MKLTIWGHRMKLLKVVLPLLLSLFLVLPVSAQTQKDLAVATMAMTPLASMDKDSALLVAATSYECAGYYVGTMMVANEMKKQGMIPDSPEFELFNAAGKQLAQFHIGLAEIVHLIHDVDEKQDLAVMREQGDKAQDFINNNIPPEINARYNKMCEGIIRTYLPSLFPRLYGEDNAI